MKKNFVFACCGVVLGLALAQFGVFGSVAAQPQPTAKRCDYTYITDNAAPGIGKNGKIEYNDTWKPLMEGGWSLKMASAPGAGYIFEKCQ